MNITFLGTASAQPSVTRNHSSLALRLNKAIWLFDCGEATQHQIQKSSVKLSKVTKIFITHMHGDHIFGLVPLLATRMNGAGGTVGAEDPRLQETDASEIVEIYGPRGTRSYVRNGLTCTHTMLSGKVVVHELRFKDDPDGDDGDLQPHPFELPGRNIIQDPDETWPNIFQDDTITVHAAPIHHSVPCVGYVICERPVPGKMVPDKYLPDIKRTKAPMSLMSRLQQGETVELPDGTVLHGPERRPGRKITILGDTHDPSPIASLSLDSDLLIHEATNAHLPGTDPNTKGEDTFENVEAKTKAHGHSTPQMAGAFAKRVKAKKLALNHFSSRYAGDDNANEYSAKVMEAIRSLALAEAGGCEVICARDLMNFDVSLVN